MNNLNFKDDLFDKETLNLKICPRVDLNHRHKDFQSSALPTELPELNIFNLQLYNIIII
jgi:hypothetical protein